MFLTMSSSLRTIFMIYTAFWVVVIAILFVGVGVLIKRQERILEKQKRAQSHESH